MKRTTLLVTLLLCCTASFALAQDGYLGSARPTMIKGAATAPQEQITAGGETFATATPIPGLPYFDAGGTCGHINDYTPSCASSSAPDVVYSFTPTADVCVNVSLCGSLYDTILHIYMNSLATLVACQDDSPSCGLQSDIQNVALVAGNTYYIVIDGYSTACGDYTLAVEECPPPPVCDPCPPLAIQEGEPVCYDGYVDTFNGGCNSTPYVFTQLHCAPSQTICGTYGAFNASGTRDTDWYEITLTAPATLNVSVNGGGVTGSALAILDNLCPPSVLCGDFGATPQCQTKYCSASVGPGTYRIFVASFFDTTPCGTPYVLTVEGPDCPTPVNAQTWGTLKSRYR